MGYFSRESLEKGENNIQYANESWFPIEQTIS